jgi:hypothetical protein
MFVERGLFAPVIFMPLLRIRQIRLAAVLHLIAFSLAFILLTHDSFAEVAIGGKTPYSTYGATITGTITAQDAKRIVELEKRGARLKLVRLNSRGGDVSAAMTIGRILRKNEGAVLLEKGDICASACVLVIAGGVVRSIHGQVLIHRPYSEATDTVGQDLAAWDKKMKSYRKQMDAYLSEMNVSVGLADAMWAISPENARALTRAEREHFLLSESDSSYDDYRSTQDARKYGLTKQEYLRRYKIVTEKCGKFATQPFTDEKAKDFSQCNESIMRQRQ